MTSELTLNLVKLRTCVAFMGEKEQANWWPSSFLSRSGEAFLSPVFPKTAALARVNGASGAAQIPHDEHIGVGNVYHLFRLPENIEHDISQHLANDGSVLELVANEATAMAGLVELAEGVSAIGVGPLLIEENTMDTTTLSHMASAYLKGFNTGEHVYPYYRSGV